MADIEIRALTEDDWGVFREVRLMALRDSPEAFVATAAEEESFPESEWRDRMTRSSRFVAEDGQDVIGVVSLRTSQITTQDTELDDLNAAEVFGLWVEPGHRGAGTPAQLIDAAANRARAYGISHLVYWVGVDNARAVAFASGYGFRPTDSRREARTAGVEGGTEAAMVFPLAR
ncbi:MAG: GNAT family N-acetyltransferase [Actinomycetales bacterium]